MINQKKKLLMKIQKKNKIFINFFLFFLILFINQKRKEQKMKKEEIQTDMDYELWYDEQKEKQIIKDNTNQNDS